MTWYRTKIDDKPAIMFFDGNNRITFLEDYDVGIWSERYRDFIANGGELLPDPETQSEPDSLET